MFFSLNGVKIFAFKQAECAGIFNNFFKKYTI